LHTQLFQSITHSLNQSPSLFDVPGTEAKASENGLFLAGAGGEIWYSPNDEQSMAKINKAS